MKSGSKQRASLEMIHYPVGDTQRTHQAIGALDEAAERIVSFAAGVAFADRDLTGDGARADGRRRNRARGGCIAQYRR